MRWKSHVLDARCMVSASSRNVTLPSDWLLAALYVIKTLLLKLFISEIVGLSFSNISAAPTWNLIFFQRAVAVLLGK